MSHYRPDNEPADENMHRVNITMIKELNLYLLILAFSRGLLMNIGLLLGCIDIKRLLQREQTQKNIGEWLFIKNRLMIQTYASFVLILGQEDISHIHT